MNLGVLIPLVKLVQDSGLIWQKTVIGPPAPEPVTVERPSSYYYRSDGKYTFAGYRKYIDSAGSGSDYQDYLIGK
jgi:hypothetical protein